jgi:hypothetical protein
VLLSRASLGAVDLKEAYGKSSPLFDAAIPSEAVSEDASETYLIWSLRELCNGRSEAAMLYAESAIATARLQRSTPAEREGKSSPRRRFGCGRLHGLMTAALRPPRRRLRRGTASR